MIVVVTGTGTEVGKTWWVAGIARRLRDQGWEVAARKPAQSFDPGDDHPHDSDVLATATGEDPRVVCPRHRSYPLAMAPPMAAEVLGRSAFNIAELAAELAPAPGAAFVLVEGAGGPRSPLASDGDTVDLARVLGVDLVIVVADAGLGTINAVRCCTEVLRGFEVAVALNRFDPADDLHRRNRTWLEDAGFHVYAEPGGLADALAETRSRT